MSRPSSGESATTFIRVWAAKNRPSERRLVTTSVKFKRLEKSEIDAYIDSGEWDGKAGGYAIQGIAEGLISRIQGSHSGVVGLPLYETRALLKSAGFLIG